MIDKIKQIADEIGMFNTGSPDELENFRIRYLSRKGSIPALFDEFKNVPAEQRKEMGKALNDLKNLAQDKYNQLKEEITSRDLSQSHHNLDLTRPVNFREVGARHPLSIVRRQILDIFARIGFTVSEGPEIENEIGRAHV